MAAIATIENMRRYPNRIAYSPVTGEECSANPSDYWYAHPGFVLRDEADNPMILVRPERVFRGVGSNDD